MNMLIQRRTECQLIYLLVMLVIVIALLPTPAMASSEARAGTLSMLQGDVYVTKGGGKREIKAFEGMGVTQGDRIRTSMNASVKVILSEDEILLGANTQILISELMDNSTVVKQSSGGLWNRAKGLLNAEDRFEVETPTSLMGVRGTNFFVQVGLEQQTTLSVFDGTVSMQGRSSTSPVQEQLVNIDEQISTGTSRTLSTPAPVDIPQFVQEADVPILVQVILNELAASVEREQKALESESLFGDTALDDYLFDALEEAYLASLLAHLAQAIMDEIEQSRYQEVRQAFDERDIGWEETQQQVRDRVEQTERTKKSIDQAADRAGMGHERRMQIVKPINDKIERLRQTSPVVVDEPSSGGGSSASPSPNPDPDQEPDPEPMATIWLETNEDGTQLFLKVKGFPRHKPSVALQIHLGFTGASAIDIESLVSSGMMVTSELLGEANPAKQAQLVQGFNSSGTQPAELMIAQTFFGEALTSGYVIMGTETMSIDLSSLRLEYPGQVGIYMLDVQFIDKDGQQIDLEIDQSIIELD